MKKKGRKTCKFLNLKSQQLVEAAVLDSEILKNSSNLSRIQENLIKLLDNGRMTTKIHFFGSRVIGLAHKESDLDIFVEYDDNFYSDKNVERDQKVLERIASIIEKSSVWEIETKILSASVPIVQVIYKPERIKCDISVSNGLGVANSLMMAYLFDLQPEAKKFYHFMEIFLKRYREYFEGYVLKLLVIFFLQIENVFPSIKLIQQNMDVTYINGWPTVEIYTSRNISHYGLKEMNNYKSYISKIFKFYSKFKYTKHVMSIYDAQTILRNKYEYREEIQQHILWIFGPLNRKHNIGKYLSKEHVQYFKVLCKSLERFFNKECNELLYDWFSNM